MLKNIDLSDDEKRMLKFNRFVIMLNIRDEIIKNYKNNELDGDSFEHDLYSIDDMAEKLNLTRKQIDNIINNKKEISLNDLIIIAIKMNKQLNISFSELRL